jgi:hypothetical protein
MSKPREMKSQNPGNEIKTPGKVKTPGNEKSKPREMKSQNPGK